MFYAFYRSIEDSRDLFTILLQENNSFAMD